MLKNVEQSRYHEDSKQIKDTYKSVQENFAQGSSNDINKPIAELGSYRPSFSLTKNNDILSSTLNDGSKTERVGMASTLNSKPH